MRIYKEFLFEAAHFLSEVPDCHPCRRVHGHSFRARVTVEGEPDPKTGLIRDFFDLERAIKAAREELDHRLLNEVPGLENPTLEVMTVWLWDRLDKEVPGIAEIALMRDSCQEGCIYTGPAREPRLAAE